MGLTRNCGNWSKRIHVHITLFKYAEHTFLNLHAATEGRTINPKNVLHILSIIDLSLPNKVKNVP